MYYVYIKDVLTNQTYAVKAETMEEATKKLKDTIKFIEEKSNGLDVELIEWSDTDKLISSRLGLHEIYIDTKED